MNVDLNASDRSKFGLQGKKSDILTLTLAEINTHFTLESTKNFVFTLDFASQTLDFHDCVRFFKKHSTTYNNLQQCFKYDLFGKSMNNLEDFRSY